MSNLAPVQSMKWSPEQMKLITDVVAKGATPDELKLFLYRCQHMGLDPLKPGQIHFVKYGSGPGTIVVGIEGFRVRAQRSGKINGSKRGVTRNDKGECIGGWAEIYRSDWQHPARVEVSLAEYTTGRGPWQKMPESMIQKVAEAGALRMAFPDELGGVYTQEEMHQAEGALPRIVPEEPGPDDGAKGFTEEYRIPFGKFAKRGLEEINVRQLGEYVNYLQDMAEKKNQRLSPVVQEFIERASAHIAALELSPIESEG